METITKILERTLKHYVSQIQDDQGMCLSFFILQHFATTTL